MEGAWSLNHCLEERYLPTRSLHFGLVYEGQKNPRVSEYHMPPGLVCYRALICHPVLALATGETGTPTEVSESQLRAYLPGESQTVQPFAGHSPDSSEVWGLGSNWQPSLGSRFP